MPGAQIALVFWSEVDAQTLRAGIGKLRTMLPHAEIIGCSTSGIIQDRLILDQCISATLVTFEHTRLKIVRGNIANYPDCIALGADLVTRLAAPDLAHVFLLSDGLHVNGSQLARGLGTALPSGVSASGGLAGDGERFAETSLLVEGEFVHGEVVCLGLYGSHLRVGTGSRGGWEPFGPERLVTASEGNVLSEVDGESALELYERYLGKHAQNLPASGHLFPLNLLEPGASGWVVRTILGVDRNRRALVFAGDIPIGSTVQLMRGNPENLLDGATEAGRLAHLQEGSALAILISCVGRKMLLKQYTDEEVEAVANTLPPGTALTGFYSYGEIAPGDDNSCCLHNQTMTVTVLSEV